MAAIAVQKLKRNGWPEDEPLAQIEESLLERTSGVDEDEDARIEWTEWRLGGLIVKRGAHVRLKRSALADGIASF